MFNHQTINTCAKVLYTTALHPHRWRAFPVRNINKMQKITLIGHIGQDAITRNVNSDTVTSFSVAVSTNYKNTQGEKQTRTTWYNCNLWNKTTLAPYLKKGTQIYIEGEPTVRIYDSRNGERAANIEIRVSTTNLLSSAKTLEEPTSNPQNQPTEDTNPFI